MNITFTLTENRLIENCIGGDRKSQRELYDMYSSKMFAVCLRYARNQMDAEDILQEGFVKLYNNLHRFRGEGSFDGWVRRIFVNTAIEHIRKKNLSAIASEVMEHIHDTDKSALDSLYEKDLIKRTTTLSDGYRTVFTMYAVDGYSHKEIAQELGITESTSKSQFSRAKALLRSMLTSKALKKCAV
jgi:RNA polymerase sigma-70 factor (ECF subfamily)